jgi:2-iminoacetate synthase ThiH
MGSPIYLKGSSRRGPTFRETVLMHAVGRLAYANSIRNIQVSWVKLGAANVQTLLRSGANDLGGTLMEESISHAAGSEHANMLSVREMHQIVSPLQRRLKQRSTLYEIVNENPQDNEYYAQYARLNRVSIRVKVD